MICYQGGSLEAFEEIYAQLAGVRRYLWHLAGGCEIADDLLQETFLQMHGREPHTTRNMRSNHGCSAWRETFF
jgi:DNA-directed RNA polymerase specialized sigma24 family protein